MFITVKQLAEKVNSKQRFTEDELKGENTMNNGIISITEFDTVVLNENGFYDVIDSVYIITYEDGHINTVYDSEISQYLDFIDSSNNSEEKYFTTGKHEQRVIVYY